MISGSCILEAEGHSFVCICSKLGDEGRFDLVFLFEGNLVVSLVAVKEGEQDTPGSGVDDLVDARKPEWVFWVMLIEICVVDAHSPLVVVFLEDQDRICQPLWVEYFFDKPGCE